jgi:hypothetical protein
MGYGMIEVSSSGAVTEGLGLAELEFSWVGLAASPLHRASTVSSTRRRPVGGSVEVRHFTAFRLHSSGVWHSCNSFDANCLPPDESVWKAFLAADFRMLPVVERGTGDGHVLQQHRTSSAADTVAKRRGLFRVHGASIHGVVPRYGARAGVEELAAHPRSCAGRNPDSGGSPAVVCATRALENGRRCAGPAGLAAGYGTRRTSSGCVRATSANVATETCSGSLRPDGDLFRDLFVR